jgi:hypothetical protein
MRQQKIDNLYLHTRGVKPFQVRDRAKGRMDSNSFLISSHVAGESHSGHFGGVALRISQQDAQSDSFPNLPFEKRVVPNQDVALMDTQQPYLG